MKTPEVSTHAFNVVKADSNQKFEDVFEDVIAETIIVPIVRATALAIFETIQVTYLFICPAIGIASLGIECAAIKGVNVLNKYCHEGWAKTARKTAQYLLVITSAASAASATVFLSIGGASWIVHHTRPPGGLFGKTPFSIATMGCIAASSILHWKIFQNLKPIK